MIHHVTNEIPPSFLDPCVAFYGILGFQQVAVPDAVAGRAVWLESRGAGAQQIHLMPVADAKPAGGHFALVCPDYEATVNALGDAGYPVEPRREHWGSPRSYVRDPAGNLIELMAWPPGGPGYRPGDPGKVLG
jgi:catechol 2,3-dioxygenase-like lactoylglutathione lyase family enzyme